jgi:tRNA(Ile)-lysidine synthase
MKHQKTVEQTVIKFIEKKSLIRKNDKILLGLSGGADSVFALYFFLKFRRKYKIEIAAVHINHNLRGDESERDAEFCRKLCKKFKVEFFSSEINVLDYASKNRKSVEEAARDLRYKEFFKISKNCGADKIVTAHNLNDNTETVLLNFLRGAGIKGLSGIPVIRDNIIRPFLILTKEDIVNYLLSMGLDFLEDSSNENVEFKRNYLRKIFIPSIKENFNPSIDITLFQLSEIMKSSSEIIEYFVSEIMGKIVAEKGNDLVLDLTELKKFPEHVFGELMRKIMIKYFQHDFSHQLSEKLKGLIFAQVGTSVDISKKITAFRDRNMIVLTYRKPGREFKKNIMIGEKINIGNKELSIEAIDRIPEKFPEEKAVEYISADNLKSSLCIRKWNYGDRINLLGMGGTKKVSDVLTDLKIPYNKRDSQYVLEYQGDIIWLVGHRISEKFKITEKTKKIVKLCLR